MDENKIGKIQLAKDAKMSKILHEVNAVIERHGMKLAFMTVIDASQAPLITLASIWGPVILGNILNGGAAEIQPHVIQSASLPIASCLAELQSN